MPWWNECLSADAAFVTNLKHGVKASVLAMRRILELKPHALFIFSESTEYVHAGSPRVVEQARMMNERRFLSLDLLFGHDVSASMYRYVTAAGGMTEDEYLWFMDQRDLAEHCIMGTDYYVTNEHVLHPGGRSTRAGDVYGYYVITRQYYDRYRVSVMHTETNRAAAHAVEWLWKEWVNLLRLREDGVPVVGFTWFGLLDMLVRPAGHEGLGQRPDRPPRPHEPGRPVRPEPQAAAGGQGLPGVDRPVRPPERQPQQVPRPGGVSPRRRREAAPRRRTPRSRPSPPPR